ncbi:MULTISPECIES: ABC transporter permease [Rothia]|jgi:ABC-2 type transport system permease protein|uniref:ABC-type multidrug transport system, permease component n=1 Tax=Rothia mucilaginosa (strain DY-18) TaxID=680646 RepID=D2NTE8_ROTMD|nr:MULTISPECIES: ABC transporter permease [Rothia]OFR26882.1 ABC transporter [Rothia sp. HMSC066G02]QXW98562.1 ABC transporter permease [Rothia mucilaginosa]BAI64924.1 ABC-type multidrug transport system, permease component [Rothia mucilaginosa DY-18]
MSNTARTENNRAAENPVEENRAEGIRMEERAANTRPKVSSIDEDEEYIPPRANYPLVRVIEQGRYETMAMLRNGEQLMLNIIFPVMALIALRFTGLIDEYANSVGVSRMDAAVPGVLALCVISTALSGQGIATGFDRRYGVLRFLATTPLGRNGLIMGKCIAVLVVVAIQFTLVAVLGYGLGWRPDAIAVSRSIITMIMGAGAFTALGLLIAGTVRAEATLAIVNIAWVILAGAGGVVFPLKSFPDWYAGIVAWSPSAALGDALRGNFIQHQWLADPHWVLIVWTVVIGFVASRKFKWSD